MFSSLAEVNDASILTFTKSNNIFAGETYEFKVIAVNSIGESIASTILSILAAQVPDAPTDLVKLSSD